ncbi:MAG: NAD(P)-dependent oxidoreductase [Gammaproteobacteria bacterium]|nr:NAD(P)-dependent oxidoreductase [Gammaproteobacteria bacterium]MBU1647628.1 NAD(P)-dependent oxidoreductase [Gammaproteobacteria bacterium]MBU1971517.1 NAD(P)-dependent oxidoreductase [Gammaproteobacteria bacterium]
MKVLLTGATGFLGRYVLGQLMDQQIEVAVVGRSHPAEFHGQFIQTNLLHEEDCASVVKHAQATHLMHLAWYAEHGAYWTSPLNMRWLNSSVRLAEAFCAAGGQKIVAAGSCAEYDWSYGYCREDITPLIPATLYGVTKDATRRVVAAVCRDHKVPFVWGRVFLPYGKGEDTRRLVPALFDVFQGKRQPFGVNASSYRDFLHVADVASGFVRLLLSNATGNHNISSGRPTQIADLVRLIASSLNCDPDVVLGLSTERPGEPEMLIGDNTKLKALGWQPLYALADIAAIQGS